MSVYHSTMPMPLCTLFYICTSCNATCKTDWYCGYSLISCKSWPNPPLPHQPDTKKRGWDRYPAFFCFLKKKKDPGDTHHVWQTPSSLQLCRELGQVVGKSCLVLELLGIDPRCPHLLHPSLTILLAKWSSWHPHLQWADRTEGGQKICILCSIPSQKIKPWPLYREYVWIPMNSIQPQEGTNSEVKTTFQSIKIKHGTQLYHILSCRVLKKLKTVC